MINVLLPMAGRSAMFDPQLYPYPLPLTEVCGRPLIEHVIENLRALDDELRFIFVVKAEDCARYHLDHTLRLLVPHDCEVVQLTTDTKGGLCSAMMAIEHIRRDEPLVIANFDQLFDLLHDSCDAGCLTFDAVHPRWSYVRVENGMVIEAAEKKPISRQAIAGFYYFASGARFIEAAQRTILNNASVDDQFFISLTFNELILDGRMVKSVAVPTTRYHSFYTPQRIEEYERNHLR